MRIPTLIALTLVLALFAPHAISSYPAREGFGAYASVSSAAGETFVSYYRDGDGAYVWNMMLHGVDPLCGCFFGARQVYHFPVDISGGGHFVVPTWWGSYEMIVGDFRETGAKVPFEVVTRSTWDRPIVGPVPTVDATHGVVAFEFDRG